MFTTMNRRTTVHPLRLAAMAAVAAGILAGCGGSSSGPDGPGDGPSAQPTTGPSGQPDDGRRADLRFDSCQTLLPAAQLKAAVAGANHLADPSHTPADTDGLSIDTCTWDAVRNPMDQEPWFEWLVHVEVLLATGEEVADPAWEDGITPADCVDIRTPGTGTAGCLTQRSESAASVHLYARLAPASYVNVSLSSADVPADALQQAAAGIVDVLAAPPA